MNEKRAARSLLVVAGLLLACRAALDSNHAPARFLETTPVEASTRDTEPVNAAPFAHPFGDDQLAIILAMGDLGEPPADPTNAVADDPRAARLGQYLFFDERLSGTGKIACTSCHDPRGNWTDGRELASGLAQLTRHTQSLWNVAYNRWFFWDGRADTLWSQALIPLEDPREHGGNRLAYAHLIHGDPELKTAYERIFGPLPDLADADRFPPEGRPVEDDPRHPHHVAWTAMAEEDRAQVNRVFANLGKCIAAFERRIVSRRSAFDRYAAALRRGDPEAPADFPPAAVRGLELFLGKAQCRNCHHGPNFTDKEFHNTLVPTPLSILDGGRFDGSKLVKQSEFNGVGPYSDDPTGEAELKIRYLAIDGHDHAKFKTPSLRNAAVTAPYMHQGQFGTLDEVVRFYSTMEGALTHTQHHPDPLMQPRNLTEEEIASLVAFLETLVDDRVPDELRSQPASPVLD